MSAGLDGGFGMKLEKKLARTGGARQRALGRVGTAAERAKLRAAPRGATLVRVVM